MKQETVKKDTKSISQLDMAKQISNSLKLPIETITQIIEMEQKLTMLSIKKGLKVCKKNYLTLTPTLTKPRKIYSHLTNLTYEVPAKHTVKIKLGEGFIAILNKEKVMKDRLCRFVEKIK